MARRPLWTARRFPQNTPVKAKTYRLPSCGPAYPTGPKSLVLIVDDPDALDPKAPKTIWVHWVLYNLPPGTTSLAEGVKVLPQDAKICLNDWKRATYGGPCPPIGRHRRLALQFRQNAIDIRKPRA